MLLLALSILLQSAAGDAAGWLAKLRAPAAEERASAQRWLARHLGTGDLASLRAAVLAGDAESRRRIVLALADDDAHVPLAVALGTDKEPSVSGIGREALAERLARWCPAWTRRGIDRASIQRAFRESSDRTVAVEARTQDRRLDVALDQLARYGPGAPPLVLDPDLALSDHPRDSPGNASGLLEGTFARVLDDLARVHRADLEGFAIPGDPDGDGEELPDAALEGPMRPWIRVRRSVAGEDRSAAERIVDWCLEVAGSADPARRSACARAVAATGWPGGIAWLEERALAAKDEAALDGVLLAAGRGLVARSLARPEVFSQLLARLARGLEGPSADLFRADTIARALAAAGSFGEKGEDLAAVAARDLQALAPREQWLRLVVIEGMRSPSPPAAAAVDSVLSAPGLPGPVRLQALRARLAMRREPGFAAPLAEPDALLAWADRAGKSSECVRLLVALGVPAPAPAGAAKAEAKAEAAKSLSLRLAELEWSFFAGQGSGAPARLVRLAGTADPEALAERTRGWVRRGAGSRFDAMLAAARALPGANVESLERLQLLSASGAADLRARWLARLAADAGAPAARVDLLCLAGMAATEADARKALVRALSSEAKLEDAAAALELAVDVLRAARREDDERAFVKALADAAREGSAAVRSRFQSDAWPPRTLPEPIRVLERDRSLDRSGL